MPFRNAFLSAIHPDDLAELAPDLKEISLFGGDLLCEPGKPVETVYFPINSAISVLTVLADGVCIETISIGYENATGLLPALTEAEPHTRICVQIAGDAFCLPAAKLRAQAYRSPRFMNIVLRFVQAGLEDAKRCAACNALHGLPGRLARWLLVSQDRVDRPTMVLTQESMSLTAGALRSSISMAASEFKHEGLIRYSRGHVEILDRARLERRACECYGADQASLRKSA